MTRFAVLIFTLALTMPGAGMVPDAHAQIAGDQYYDFEKEGVTPHGADDSTTGAGVIVAEEAGIGLSPSSLNWSGDSTNPATRAPQTVTITNTGRLFSLGQITPSMTGAFDLIANSCHSLTSGQTCEMRVAPRAGQTGHFTGKLTINSQSGKSEAVDLTADICMSGYVAVPDRPGECGQIWHVYSGSQYGSTGALSVPYCGSNINRLNRCGSVSPAGVDHARACLNSYGDFQLHGTCIAGYNCPTDKYPSPLRPNCGGATWDHKNPGARCVHGNRSTSTACLP